MVRALDLGTKDRGDRRPFRFQVTTLGKLFIHITSVTKQKLILYRSYDGDTLRLGR